MKRQKLLKLTGVLLCMGMLAGCGAKTTTETNTQATETEAQTTEVTEAASQVSEESEATSQETEAQTQESEAFQPQTVSAAGWNITVEDVQKNASLENVSVELGYTGVEKSDYQKAADAGKVFCLVKMLIEKDGSKETMEWDKLKLTDGNGNEYTRMSDEFLTDLGMKRMTGNTLNFGSNEGWIVFEIDENAENLELSYSFEAEEYHCTL